MISPRLNKNKHRPGECGSFCRRFSSLLFSSSSRRISSSFTLSFASTSNCSVSSSRHSRNRRSRVVKYLQRRLPCMNSTSPFLKFWNGRNVVRRAWRAFVLKCGCSDWQCADTLFCWFFRVTFIMFRFRYDLHCDGWGVKLYSLTYPSQYVVSVKPKKQTG